MSKIIFLSGVSGSGKSTIMKELVQDERIVYVPSVSTRTMREGEKQGQPYFFVTKEEFLERVDNGDMLESNTYADNMYGSDKQSLLAVVAEGFFPMKEIDTNGIELIKKNNSLSQDQYMTIFLTLDDVAMTSRILGRQPDIDADELQKRLLTAENERACAEGVVDHVVDGSPTVEEVVKTVKEIIGCVV